MYPFFNEENIGLQDLATPEDCFAEKARNFYWILGILLIGVLLFLIIKYLDSSNKVTVNTAVRQYANANTVAYSPCPYCPGSLDSQGRCNSPACPLYSPNWGNAPTAAAAVDIPSAGKSTLIKELAVEVASVVDGGVTIHSIYVGGNAQKSGLLKGDIITNFNGRNVKDSKQFQKIVALAKPESYVSVEYIRDGQSFTANVMIGEGEMEGVVKPIAGALQAAKPVAIYPPPLRR